MAGFFVLWFAGLCILVIEICIICKSFRVTKSGIVSLSQKTEFGLKPIQMTIFKRTSSRGDFSVSFELHQKAHCLHFWTLGFWTWLIFQSYWFLTDYALGFFNPLLHVGWIGALFSSIDILPTFWDLILVHPRLYCPMCLYFPKFCKLEVWQFHLAHSIHSHFLFSAWSWPAISFIELFCRFCARWSICIACF